MNEFAQRRRPLWYYIAAILLGVLISDLMARGAYLVLYPGQKDRLIQAFMGLAGKYNPDMVSNYVPHPYLVYVLNPRQTYLEFYGQPPKHFINSLGFRGKEFTKEKSPGVYRIICIGASTTFSLGESDETKTYPQQLEDDLNSVFDSPRFEVINAGTPGWTSAESLINFQFRLLELKPDMIITYEGVNDTFAARMKDEGKSDYSNFRQIVDYKPATALERFLFSVSGIYRFYFIHSRNISFDINSISTKPYPEPDVLIKNLDTATGKIFRSNLESIVAIAKSRNITPVLMTMGHGVGWDQALRKPVRYHPVLARFNQITRDVAGETGADLVDFEAVAQPSYFLEDLIHLKREGNTAMAQFLVKSFSAGAFPFHKRASD